MVPATRIASTAVSAATLVLAATALAVTPKSGTYRGLTSGPVVLGFAPPVSFTLPASGRSLTRFRYSTFGCSNLGGQSETTGDAYLMPAAVKSIGKVPLSSNGKFSVQNVKSTYRSGGQTTTTITSISGKFTSKDRASGTITFSQRFHVPGHALPSCGPTSVTFTAKPR